MMTPSIHLNGTSREALLEALSDANRALLDAMTALEGCAPNARDYYPQGDQAFGLARSEHADRVRRIADVREEICELTVKIDETR